MTDKPENTSANPASQLVQREWDKDFLEAMGLSTASAGNEQKKAIASGDAAANNPVMNALAQFPTRAAFEHICWRPPVMHGLTEEGVYALSELVLQFSPQLAPPNLVARPMPALGGGRTSMRAQIPKAFEKRKEKVASEEPAAPPTDAERIQFLFADFPQSETAMALASFCREKNVMVGFSDSPFAIFDHKNGQAILPYALPLDEKLVLLLIELLRSAWQYHHFLLADFSYKPQDGLILFRSLQADAKLTALKTAHEWLKNEREGYWETLVNSPDKNLCLQWEKGLKEKAGEDLKTYQKSAAMAFEEFFKSPQRIADLDNNYLGRYTLMVMEQKMPLGGEDINWDHAKITLADGKILPDYFSSLKLTFPKSPLFSLVLNADARQKLRLLQQQG
ncbi:MAG: DUF6782 family putative metallopeptidase [Alphaproteobacteria bacterium]